MVLWRSHAGEQPGNVLCHRARRRRQLGADYPFDDSEARRSFNYYGSILYGSRFKKA